MRIALDALGGDRAPDIAVEGARRAMELAVQEGMSELEVVLVGDRTQVVSSLTGALPPELAFLDIPMTPPDAEDPHLVGSDPDSAIRTALRLHARGEFDAVVSAGGTGAQVLASLLELEKCSGITRPAVGAVLPTAAGPMFLVDVGASLVASPHHLVQFAVMGQVYARVVLGVELPRIGLLNVGRESGIGEHSVVEAHRLLAESPFDFIGNVEGRDLPAGIADVVVTNGFTGNVVLKMLEGLPPLLSRLMPELAAESGAAHLARAFDYQSLGGEPLLGVKGVSLICHGASDADSIAASIFKAARIARAGIDSLIEAQIEGAFDSYFSRVKYLRSFRRGLKWSLRAPAESDGLSTVQGVPEPVTRPEPKKRSRSR
ncbi:MAG: phosphate acyltransferase [Calditrichaeota bacterium]|nr:phosphate acyltransferase [Calditrichota bacterium]